MSGSLWMPLLAAGVTVLIAALGYLAAQLNAHTRALTESNTALLSVAAAQRPRGARATDQNGGGATARPYPVWNQLDDPLPTGTLPSLGYEECGEECCAMVIAAQHGVEVEADALRAQLGGPGGQALTSAGDLVKILGRNNVAAVAISPAVDDLAAVVQAAIGDGRAAVVLGHWLAPGVLHWVLVTRADAAGCGYNDPWGGRRVVRDWADFRALYAGSVVEVTRRPDAAS